MHPDQFTLINSIDQGVFIRSVRELRCHTGLLDIMGFDHSAKIQIHVGRVYGNREKSIERSIKRYQFLDERIASRLVIENDDRNFPVADCVRSQTMRTMEGDHTKLSCEESLISC